MRIATSTESSALSYARLPPVATQPEAAPPPAAKPQTKSELGYISPVIHVDNAAGVALLQFRDGQSGEVTNQIPSENVIRLYRQGQKVVESAAGQTNVQQAAKPINSGSEGGAPAPAIAAPAPAETGGTGGVATQTRAAVGAAAGAGTPGQA
jgi:hypothetical protein